MRGIRLYLRVGFALEMRRNLGDVKFNNRGEFIGISNGLNSVQELRVPEQGMSSHQDFVLLSEADNRVGIVKSELAPSSLGSIPLHAILGSNLAEIRLDHLGVFLVAEQSRVCNSAVIRLALGNEAVIDAGSATCVAAAGRW